MTVGPVLVFDKLMLPLARYTNVLGRFDPATQVRPDIDLAPLGLGHSVSRRHAELSYRDGAFAIRDLGSKLGTAVNGEFLAPGEEVGLVPGDTVTVGAVTLTLEREREWPPGLIAEWQGSSVEAGATIAGSADLVLLGELPAASRNGELVLFFQPQVTLATGKMSSVEALLRWQHPVRGLLGPDHFVPIAENTGFIRQLTNFVILEGARQARSWQDAGTPRSMSVNVSVRDLEDAGFVERAQSAVAAGGAQPEDLLLEITESAVMSSPEQALSAISALKEAGFRFGIDDFGTGESSLAYLSKLRVDEVKLDRAFAMDLHSRNEAIARGAVTMGHELGLVVVAEGIEEQVAADRLGALGFDKGQGYLFGRPMAAIDLDRTYPR